MTPVEVVEALREAGLDLRPGEIALEIHGDRVAVRLPGDRMAWLPANARGREHLEIERRVLKLLNERCTFRIPKLLFCGHGGWDLRTLAPGEVDPTGYAARLKADAALLLRTARFLGSALAEQHSRIQQADVASWLPRVVSWPMARETLQAQVPLVIDDAELRGRIARAMAAYWSQEVDERDRALVHADLGLHNLAFDPTTGDATGLFDYGDAAWVDRHHDFRYLVFGAIPDALLDATLRAYAELTGLALRRDRILLYNAACAISHLAFRVGSAPEEEVAGRTLAQDLVWTRWALKRSGF